MADQWQRWTRIALASLAHPLVAVKYSLSPILATGKLPWQVERETGGHTAPGPPGATRATNARFHRKNERPMGVFARHDLTILWGGEGK